MSLFPDPSMSKMWLFNNRRIDCKTKRCWLPKTCYLSGKKLWLKKCEVITTMVTGPGFPVYETYWCDPREFLLHELKR